jgi:putative membrane protein
MIGMLPPIFGAALALATASAAAVPAEPYYGWGPQMMWGVGWGGMIFAPFLMLLLLALVLVAVALLVRWLAGASHAPPPQHVGSRPSAIDILKERFARGEIDKQEFEERRRVLGE